MKAPPSDVPSTSPGEQSPSITPAVTASWRGASETTAAGGNAVSFLVEDEASPVVNIDHCGSRFVLLEQNPVRIAWSAIVLTMLVYIATIFLYRFTFLFFHIGPDGYAPLGEQGNDSRWTIIDWIVDIVFGIDLAANFFFSFRNARGCEVNSMRLIAFNYLTGYFWINVLGCIPDPVSQAIVRAFVGDEDGNATFRVARITRLQRITRLGRLLRLARLAKCLTFKSAHQGLWRSFQRMRGLRIVNFIFGLLWTVHLLACGWYLCAALHADVAQTWVARRQVTWHGDPMLLLEAPPKEQWLHSMYFVATVFTTVGFGDISAGTEFEIVYVFITMLVGAVVHSIVIGEVIRILTSTEKVHEFIQNQLELVEAFSKHTHLGSGVQMAIRDEVYYRAQDWMTSFDKDRMKELVLGTYLPRHLMASIPPQLFGGRLLKNDLFASRLRVPPRVPCLLAVYLHPLEFDAGEIVYQKYDFSFSMFLVLYGTFAHVALPHPNGGADAPCQGLPTSDGMLSPRSSPHFRNLGFREGFAKTMARSKPLGHKHEGTDESPSMFPYRLHSCNSYFGEMGLLQTRPRVSTVRCETSAARALALYKQDFAELKEQFPQFAVLWQTVAQRREWARRRQLKRLVGCGLNYRVIAVLSIQRFWRKLKRSISDLAGSKSTPRLGQGKRTVGAAEQMNFLDSIDSDSRKQNKELVRMQESVEGLRRNMDTMQTEMRRVVETLGSMTAKLGSQPAPLAL